MGKPPSTLAAEHAHKNKVSLSEAARLFGVTRSAVSQASARHGLSKRSPTQTTHDDLVAHGWPTRLLIENGSRTIAAANDVIRGMGVFDAAAKHRVALSGIYKTLKCPPISALQEAAIARATK